MEDLEFIEHYEPEITKIYDECEWTGKWHLFSLPTQHCPIRFDSFKDAFEYGKKYTEENGFSPNEKTWFSRTIHRAEAESVPMPSPDTPFDWGEIDKYMETFLFPKVKKLFSKNE